MPFTGQIGTASSQLAEVVPGYGAVAQPAATSDPGDATVSASKFYLQNRINPNAIYPANGHLSSALPNGSLVASSGDAYESLYLSPVKGSAQTQVALVTLGQTARQDLYFARFISDFLQAGQTIDMGTSHGTFACAASELTVQVNAFFEPSVYIWRPSSASVVGYLFDGASNTFGSEFDTSETGRVAEMIPGTGGTPSVVTTQAGDVLVVEVWAKVAQSDLGVHGASIYFGGTTDPTDTTATSDAASYITMPVTLYFGNSASLATGAGSGGVF